MQSAARITLVTGGLLLAAAWALGAVGVLADHRSVAGIMPEVVGVLLVVLAWRFRRHRLALAALLLAAANSLIRTTSGGPDEALGRAALSVVVAVDLAALALLRDRPLWRPTAALWLGLIALQVWWAGIGVHLRAPEVVTQSLERPLLPEAILLTAGLVVVAAFAVRRTAFEAGLVWLVAAIGAAIPGWRGAHEAALLLTAGQLVLLISLMEESYHLAYHDELTGLPGRRSLKEALRLLPERFSIAMADVDHFKRFNDRHGHDAGDQALRMVADELARVGGGGRAFRYGGEEFAILFPGKAAMEVRSDLEALRSAVEKRRFALRGSDRPRRKPEGPRKRRPPPRRVTVTVSVGVADTSSRRTTADAVLRAADKALYRAKRAGRNRVVAAGERL